MADLSKITLPNGAEYNIKDAVARDMISSGFSYQVCNAANNTPQGVTWGTVTGTLTASASTKGIFYLVPSSNSGDDNDTHDEYITISSGSVYSWEKIGNTKVNLSDFGNLAFKDNVTTSLTESTKSVLGVNATFSNTTSNVTLNTPDKLSVMGTSPQLTAPGYTGVTKYLNKQYSSLVTTTVRGVSGTTNVPNVTSAGTTGSAASWSATVSNENLIISWTPNVPTTAATLGTAISVATAASDTTIVATGGVDSSGTGETIITDVSVSSTASSGSISYTESVISSGTDDITIVDSDSKSVVSELKGGTAAAQTISISSTDAATALISGTTVSTTVN